MPEIILTFELDGKTVKKETKGFVGNSCVSKSAFIEKALGKPKNRMMKSEYYETERNQEQDRIQY